MKCACCVVNLGMPSPVVRRHHFFEMAVPAALLVCLAACSSDDGRRTLEECHANGMRFYPGYSLAELNSPGGRFLIECMAKHGYELSGQGAGCDSKRPLILQDTCFEYSGTIKHLLGLRPSVPDWLE